MSVVEPAVRTSLVSVPCSPAAPDHARAERLLQVAERCPDESRRQDLHQKAVLLTLDLAESVARRYSGRGIDYEDLLQVARMALVKAVQRYRSDRGQSFAAYAAPTISGEVKRHFRDCGWAVRPPRRLQEVVTTLGACRGRLQQQLQREPGLADLAEVLGVSADEVRAAQGCGDAYTALSLDAPAPGTSMALELPSTDADPFESVDTRDALRRAIAELSERERRVIYLRFVEEQTQTEIGAEIGVSQMQVSRILGDILARIRQHIEADPDATPSPQSKAS